jgi:rod shape-determining protein MreD
MRRLAIPLFIIFILGIVESSVLPLVIEGNIRPNLLLVIMTLWISFYGSIGFLWVFLAGLFLDLLASTPFGIITLGMLTANIINELLDQTLTQSGLARQMVRVAFVTMLTHVFMVISLLLRQININMSDALLGVILPTVVVNCFFAIPVFFIFKLVERFAIQQRQQIYR